VFEDGGVLNDAVVGENEVSQLSELDCSYNQSLTPVLSTTFDLS
jgi:hypothetical protein